ncbi:hypothetical protein [uncultured Gilvimarinus sp.]|uniref:hypothetical protein n=1 Tax=uncultured Gilvimarinus sp. TaxID=1689143 RepID=UPI0030EF39D6|tara:strand:- start:490 stop:972 length:483 start_codon:yes stop_codon:yes gene_type:complete
MSIFTARTTVSSLIAGLALTASSVALAADVTLKGVVQSVDYETNSLTVLTDKTGELVTYGFTGTPKIDLDGRKSTDMASVEVGQNVKLKLNKITKPQTVVKAEILEVNLEQNIALIRPADGGAPRVIDLPEAVAISGLHDGAETSDLKEGQFVTLKYSAK